MHFGLLPLSSVMFFFRTVAQLTPTIYSIKKVRTSDIPMYWLSVWFWLIFTLWNAIGLSANKMTFPDGCCFAHVGFEKYFQLVIVHPKVSSSFKSCFSGSYFSKEYLLHD